MKPIILDIKEMSDSREVYESKPNIFIPLFIYGILGMLMIALAWMYFGRIDVVVKSEGILRPNNQVGTIMNTFSGILQDVQVSDGEYVHKGDVLYIIEHKEVLSELEYHNNLLEETKETLEMLNKYKQSVKEGVNHFANDVKEEEFYLKFQGYMINYELAKKEAVYNEKDRELKLGSIANDLTKEETKLGYTNKLKQSVERQKNLFTKSGSEKEYYRLYQKYVSDYNVIVKQYEKEKMNIDSSTTEENLTDKVTYYSDMLEGFKVLKSSIEDGKGYFKGSNSYSLQYDEYKSNIEELTKNYNHAKENYEINQLLKGLAVTEREVEQSKLTMEEEKRKINSFKNNFLESLISKIAETEKNLKELKLTKDHTKSKSLLYQLNKKEKEAAIEDYQLKYNIDLDYKIASLELNIVSLKRDKSNLELQEEANYYVDNEEEQLGSIVEYRNNELRTTIDNINSYDSKKEELESVIEKLRKQIDDAVVKATKDGLININFELVEGDVVASGVEVMTIIPEDNSRFKVNIYVSNADIGKLKEGMDVKFNIYALPNSEYGYVNGTITKISKDLKVDSNNSSSYYLAESDINDGALYNSKGEKGILKTGMACQAQMITENKRILHFILEKMDMWN